MKHIASLVAALLFIAALAGSPAVAGPGGFSGKVTETMDAAGYTYVLVDTGTNKVWAATTKFPVKKGDLVAVPDAMPMKDFESKALKRTFPVIYFAGSISVNGARPGAEKLPAGHPAVGGGAVGGLPVGHPPIDGKATPPPSDFTGIKPAQDGNTVAEIHAASAKLEGKSVKLRGKVVKYNANILGKNWLHLQDGTGSAGSNDLLVTTTGQAKRGDTVLIVGKVTLNGEDVNIQMIHAGLAWHYKAYEDEQPAVDRVTYPLAELNARRKAIGLWGDAEPVPPWDWRRSKRQR